MEETAKSNQPNRTAAGKRGSAALLTEWGCRTYLLLLILLALGATAILALELAQAETTHEGAVESLVAFEGDTIAVRYSALLRTPNGDYERIYLRNQGRIHEYLRANVPLDGVIFTLKGSTTTRMLVAGDPPEVIRERSLPLYALFAAIILALALVVLLHATSIRPRTRRTLKRAGRVGRSALHGAE